MNGNQSGTRRFRLPMKYKIDIQNKFAVKLFSELLIGCREPLTVEIDNASFCPNRIVPIVALADLFRRRGGLISFDCLSGTAAEAACIGFFENSLNPNGRPSSPLGRVLRFDNSTELSLIVNSIEESINQTARLAKGVRICFSWCLNEVMDNVLTHSSPVGSPFGYVMVQYIPSENLLKACVFDTGIGLWKSFDGSRYSPRNPEEAIRLAVEENVTSGDGQGNGLYGLRRLVGQSLSGRLHIRSDGAEYLYDPSRGIDNSRNSWNLSGFNGTTFVDFQIRCDGELSLATVFPGSMDLVDLWTENREDETGAVRILVRDTVSGCGSRDSGKEIRTLVENLIEADGHRVVVDFDGIDICSSGFADEFLGKLLAKYDFVAFSQLVRIVNIQGVAALLINHSIAQRLALKQDEDSADQIAAQTPDGNESSSSNAMGSSSEAPPNADVRPERPPQFPTSDAGKFAEDSK